MRINQLANMKTWAIAASILILGTSASTPLAHADPSVQPRAQKTVPFQGAGGRDISQSAWQSWQAPVGTVDPERLIPSDSTDSTATAAGQQYHFDSFKGGSFQLASGVKEGKPIQVEESKSIEAVENQSDNSAPKPAAVVATAAPKPKNDSHRVLMIAFISVAVLGYRKFRRANASQHPPKPNFL